MTAPRILVVDDIPSNAKLLKDVLSVQGHTIVTAFGHEKKSVATFDALKHCASPRSVATRRGKKVSEIFGRRDAPGTVPTAAAPAEEQPNA